MATNIPEVDTDGPQSLMALCMEYCSLNLEGTLCYWRDDTLRLRADICLPAVICDQLVNDYMELVNVGAVEHKESFFNDFTDPQNARLKRIHLQTVVRDQDLEAIQKQELEELFLTNCTELTGKSLRTLVSFRSSIASLSLFGCSNIFRKEKNLGGRKALVCDFTFEGFNQLRCVNLGNTTRGVNAESLLQPLTSLTDLNLSGFKNTNITFLTKWRDSLRSLVLYNMDLCEKRFQAILQLHNLRHLDISRKWRYNFQRHSRSSYKFKMTRKVLNLLIENLVNLTSLDISGNNMWNVVARDTEEKVGGPSNDPENSSIIPFRNLKEPLQFLGLYETILCQLLHIPAYKVTGTHTEDQLLSAMEAYSEHRPEIATNAICILEKRLLADRCSQPLRTLQLVIAAMKYHKDNKFIQQKGSDYFILFDKSSQTNQYLREMNAKLRRQFILVALNGLEPFQEVTVQRNFCNLLENFNIPKDVEFQYLRFGKLLLNILNSTQLNKFDQPCLVGLFYSFVLNVDKDRKEALGKMGFVKTMLQLIRKKLDERFSDLYNTPGRMDVGYLEVMYLSWKNLCFITDETPDNCEMFLSFGGLKLFVECWEKFPDDDKMCFDMLGPLENVATVQELRPQLTTSQAISVFSNLLDYNTAVSHEACGILSHIMVDGPEAWGICEPCRDEVINKMWATIQRWGDCRISYKIRSFEPVLRLIPQEIAPVSQHWAVWTLQNLNSIFPEDFRSLLIREGGLPLLRDMIDTSSARPETKELGRKVIKRCTFMSDTSR